MNKKEKNQRFPHYNFFPKSRKGSHVGVIASFGIFVLFLVGIYLVVDPMIRIQRDKQLILNYLETEIINLFSENLTTAVISSLGSVCLDVDDSLVDIGPGNDAIVKDNNSQIIGSTYSEGTLTIDSTSDTILWIYYAKVDFENTSGSGTCEVPTIESVRTTKEIFEEKIINSFKDFENFKLGLNVPSGSDFSMSFEMENNTLLNSDQTNFSGNIYVKEIPIQYINASANNLAGKLTIKVR